MEPLSNEVSTLILRYVDNDMSPEERFEFEKALKNDKALQEEVEFERSLLQIGQSASKKIEDFLNAGEETKNDKMVAGLQRTKEDREEEMGKTFSTAPAQTVQRSGRIIRMQKWTMLSAAAVLGIIVLVGVLWYQQHKASTPDIAVNDPKQNPNSTVPDKLDNTTANNPATKSDTGTTKEQLHQEKNDVKPSINTQELFTASFKPDIAPEGEDPSLDEALAFYKAHEYDNAIESLEELTIRGENQSDIAFYVHYYLALSYMAANDQSRKAVTELKMATGLTLNKDLKNKVKWYLALAYLKEKNLTETRTLLEQLANNHYAGVFRQKAQDILKQLSP